MRFKVKFPSNFTTKVCTNHSTNYYLLKAIMTYLFQILTRIKVDSILNMNYYVLLMAIKNVVNGLKTSLMTIKNLKVAYFRIWITFNCFYALCTNHSTNYYLLKAIMTYLFQKITRIKVDSILNSNYDVVLMAIKNVVNGN